MLRRIPDQRDDQTAFYLHIQAQLEALRAAAPDTSGIEPRQFRLMRLRGEPGPDGTAARWHRAGELHGEVTAALREDYLTGVSPVVAERFDRAITWRSRQTARRFADFFAASAVAFTHPDAVTAVLAGRQPRAVGPAVEERHAVPANRPAPRLER